MKKILLLSLFFVLCAFGIYAQDGVISTAAGIDSFGYSGDGGPATAAQLGDVSGIAFDTFGNYYIVDAYYNVLRKVNTHGIVSTFAGDDTWGSSGDGGIATLAQLNIPTAVCVDRHNNIYIADEYNNRIRKIDTAGIISTFAGNGDSLDYGDGGLAISAGIFQPVGICFDDSNNLYITEGVNSVIRKVNVSGIITTFAGIDSSNGYSGDGGLATLAKLYDPVGICADHSGNIYFTDTWNQVIRMVNTSGIISTIAGNGIEGYSGDGGPADSAKFSYPVAICLDTIGDIIIADKMNGRVRKISTTGIITTIAGNGGDGYSGDGGLADSAQIGQPNGLAYDKNFNLYISDEWNGVVRKIKYSSLSVPRVEKVSEIAIFPNPTTSSFTITSSEVIKSIAIFNVLGQQALYQECNTQRVDIGGQILPPGVYTVKITGDSGEQVIRKLVKG